MKASELKDFVISLFDETKIAVEGESGFHIDDTLEIKKIGYATNLTPETVKTAINQGVNLVITHHDAWNFMSGMKDYCINTLKECNKSHFYIHMPLDDAEFGTNVSFMNRIGIYNLEKVNLQDSYFYCGRIGELEDPIDFEVLVSIVEEVLGEKVKSWKNNSRKVKKIGFLSGAGHLSSDIKEHVEHNCDVYITGEKILYTVQYSEFAGINLIVGSHTYTEIFGVQSLCEKIKDKYHYIEIIRLNEEHKE